MRSPLSSAHQSGFGVSGGAALGGRPRRFRNSPLGAPRFPAPGATMDIDFQRQQAFVHGVGLVSVQAAVNVGLPSGSAYRTNSSGVLVPATSLLDYDPLTGECLGYLVEENTTTAVLDGSDFSTINWTLANTTRGAKVLAPDGTLSAVPISNGPPNGSYVLGTMATTLPITQLWYARSVFMQPVTGTGVIAMESFNGTGFSVGVFNGLTGVASAGGSDLVKMVPYPNGWWRCIHMFQTSGVASPNMRVVYIGAYGNTAIATTVNLWGHMVEQKVKYATSYSNGTRGACSLSLPMGDWFNPQRGSFYAEFRGGREAQQGDYGRVLSPGPSSNVFLSRTAGASNGVACWFGGTELNVSPGFDVADFFVKSAMSYEMKGANADLFIYANGFGARQLNGSASLNASNIGPNVGIGQNSNSNTNMLNGHIKRIIHMPFQSPEALYTMTAPGSSSRT